MCSVRSGLFLFDKWELSKNAQKNTDLDRLHTKLIFYLYIAICNTCTQILYLLQNVIRRMIQAYVTNLIQKVTLKMCMYNRKVLIISNYCKKIGDLCCLPPVSAESSHPQIPTKHQLCGSLSYIIGHDG